MSSLYRILKQIRHTPIGEKIANTSLFRKLWRLSWRLRHTIHRFVEYNPFLNYRIIKRVLPHIRKDDVYQGIETLTIVKKGIIGRVCGDVGDSLSQYLCIVQYVRENRIKNFNSLEIGTLFGGSCLMKLFAMRNLGCSGSITCIDPMSGYYGKEYDPHSKVPVNRHIFYSNIKNFEFSEQDVKLIAEMSNSPNAFKELKEKSYATLLIDGDHSYDGVKYDWEHYNKYVAEDGFVLFDDYGESGWPDITKFVDQKIESLPRGWKACGEIGTTFIMQRIPITNVNPPLNLDILKNLNRESEEILKKTIPQGYIASPEQQANVILFLASDEANYMTGAIVDVNGGKL